MEGKRGYTDEQGQFVYDWCNKYLTGKDNARHRPQILPFLSHQGITDRLFRKIFNDIGIKEGFYSSASRGYWVLPAFTTDRAEMQAALDALAERKSKAISIIEGINAQVKILEAKLQEQKEMFV